MTTAAGRADSIERAAIIADIVIEAASRDELDAILEVALGRLARHIPLTGGSIALVEDDALVVRAAVGPFTDEVLGGRALRNPSSASWRVIDTREPLFVEDTLEAGLRDAIRGGPPRVRSMIAVPLTWQARSLGLLEVDSTERAAFQPADLDLLEAVATTLSGPIELAARRALLDRADRGRELLAGAGALVGTTLDDRAMLAGLARLLVPAMGDYVLVDLVGETDVERVAAVHADPDKAGLMAEMVRYPPDPTEERGVGGVLRTGHGILAADISPGQAESTAMEDRHAELLHALGPRSALIVPVPGRSGPVAALTLSFTRLGRRYETADLELVEELARRVGQALEISRLVRELDRERGRFEAVVRQLPAGLLIADAPEGRIVLANEEVSRILGNSPTRIGPEGREADYSAIHEDGTPYTSEEYPLARAVTVGEVTEQETVTFLLEDGTRRIVSVNAGPIRDVDGRIRSGVMTLFDVTARATAEAEQDRLTRELVAFKNAVDAIADGVLMVDPGDRRLTYVNRGAERLLRRPSQELIGSPLVELLPDYDEERLSEVFANLSAGGAGITLNGVVRRRRSGEFPGEVHLQRVAPEGAPEIVIAIVRDITDRVDARARLQRLAQTERSLAAELGAVIQAIGDGVLVFEGEDQLGLANPAAEEMFEGKPPTSLRDLLDRLALTDGHPTIERLLEGPVELPLAGPASVPEQRARRRPRSGNGAVEDGPGPMVPRQRWVEVVAYPIEAPGAGLHPGPDLRSETIVVLRDVTEAREARLTRDAFVGVLSHELRTPVTTIFGVSKLLARGSRQTAAVRRDALLDIEGEAERLYRLVEDLLVLARFETGGTSRIELEPVLLQRLIPAVLRSEQARWPSAELVSDLPSDLPPVRGEPTYVEQILRNLVGNAAKYSGVGQVLLQAEAREDEVRVRVIDEGPGLAEDDLGRLFELFYRSPHTTRIAGGAGIGLFVCRQLIESMDGRIWARPRSDRQGAEFTFSLRPFREEEL
jgi:PAS domain S-box-containing protein